MEDQVILSFHNMANYMRMITVLPQIMARHLYLSSNFSPWPLNEILVLVEGPRAVYKLMNSGGS